jgi:phosphoribosylformylglycinamidine (FGAM) synthase-like enzyme
MATGTVTSVSGSTVLLQGVLRTGRPGAGMTPTPTATNTLITVTLGSSTTVTSIQPATSAAAVVGKCAAAIGKADSTGTVAATSIAISSPGPNGCQAGFGGPGGFGRVRFGGGNPGGSAGSGND